MQIQLYFPICPTNYGLPILARNAFSLHTLKQMIYKLQLIVHFNYIMFLYYMRLRLRARTLACHTIGPRLIAESRTKSEFSW